MALRSAYSSDKTITVQEFIALQTSDEITYYNYSILKYINGFEMFITNVLYDYDTEFQELAVNVKLSDLEYSKYKYRPDLLAYDIYGSVECKFIIMMINNIIDPKEFDFKTVKMIRKGDLTSILSRIESVNDDYISNNRNTLASEIKNNPGNTIWGED